MAGFLVVGLLWILVWPKGAEETRLQLERGPWKSLGLGFVLLVVVPVAAALLLITVVGLPLSLMALGLYAALIYLSPVPVAMWIGEGILKAAKVGGRHHAVGGFLLGMALLLTFFLIPWLGGLLRLLVTLAGLGAILLALVSWARRAPSPHPGPIVA